jgi:hypothetical protein
VNGSRVVGWIWLGLASVVVLLLGACGSGSAESGSGGTSSSASGATPGSTSDSSASATNSEPTNLNSTPSAEGTGPEQPQSQQSRPSVEVVGLPIGGNSDPQGAAQQCVGVSWISNTALLPGFALTVMEVPVTEPFTLAGGCPGGSHPSCLNFVFDASNTASGSGTSCEVAVQWDPHSKATGDANVSLNGQLTCPSGTDTACAQLKASIEAQKQTISVTPPPPASVSSSESSPSTSGSEQSSTPDTSSPES